MSLDSLHLHGTLITHGPLLLRDALVFLGSIQLDGTRIRHDSLYGFGTLTRSAHSVSTIRSPSWFVLVLRDYPFARLALPTRWVLKSRLVPLLRYSLVSRLAQYSAEPSPPLARSHTAMRSCRTTRSWPTVRARFMGSFIPLGTLVGYDSNNGNFAPHTRYRSFAVGSLHPWGKLSVFGSLFHMVLACATARSSDAVRSSYSTRSWCLVRLLLPRLVHHRRYFPTLPTRSQRPAPSRYTTRSLDSRLFSRNPTRSLISVLA